MHVFKAFAAAVEATCKHVFACAAVWLRAKISAFASTIDRRDTSSSGPLKTSKKLSCSCQCANALDWATPFAAALGSRGSEHGSTIMGAATAACLLLRGSTLLFLPCCVHAFSSCKLVAIGGASSCINSSQAHTCAASSPADSLFASSGVMPTCEGTVHCIATFASACGLGGFLLGCEGFGCCCCCGGCCDCGSWFGRSERADSRQHRRSNDMWPNEGDAMSRAVAPLIISS